MIHFNEPLYILTEIATIQWNPYKNDKDYSDEEGGLYPTDGYMFTLNGKQYVAVENPDDGYRSYLDICKVSDAPSDPKRNTIKYDEIIINTQTRLGKGIKVEIEEVKRPNFEGIIIRNAGRAKRGKLILKLGTDISDDWYPVAVFEYHLENA